MDPEKALNCAPRHICGVYYMRMGFSALSEAPFGPCMIEVGVRIVSQTCSQCILDFSRNVLSHWFCLILHLWLMQDTSAW